ncbi:MAG TPA: hypothetical protein VL970_01530, partial [Candidatus Acidoferrales bacterium]|nr:hypothetical protein [Candidatus Acidoferrales bacterium]
MAVQTQAQTVIDPLNGTVSIPYSTYLILDNSDGAGEGVSFGESSSGLSASYVGTGTSAEQALYLAPATSFSSTFSVGDTLMVDSPLAASSTAEDLGLAISASNPSVASAANSWNARPTFDYLSISVRPSGTSPGGTLRVNTSSGGSVVTSSFNLDPTLPIDALYIDWVSGTTFSFGYIDGSGNNVPDGSFTFGGASTIGTDIGFYGDLRATGTSLGDFSNLTIVPEPSTMALCGTGLSAL